MMIKSLSLKNIRSYMDERIEFPQGTTLLSGNIGCGKSTILMAIEFALFGLQRGELSGSDLLRHGSDEGKVELKFSVDEKDVNIRRSLRKKKNITQESGFLEINGTQEQLTPIELKAKILDMIGYSQELLKKKKPLFRYTVYTPQEEMKNILQDEASRMETLRKIFDIDKYGTIRNNSRTFMTELRAMRRENEAFAKDLDEKKKQLQDNHQEEMQLKSNMNDAEKNLQEWIAKENEINERINSARKEMDEIRSLSLDLAQKESELRSAQSRSEQLMQELTDIDRKIETNRSLISDTVSDLQEIRNSIKKIEQERDTAMKEVAVVDSEARKMKSILDEGVCSFCGQNVQDPASYKQHIEGHEKKSAELRSVIEKSDTDLARLKKEREAVEKKEHVTKTLNDLQQWKQSKEQEKVRLNESVQTLTERINHLKPQTEGMDARKKEFEEMETERTQIVREKTEQEKKKVRIEQQLSDMLNRKEEIGKDIINKEEAKKKAERISETLSWFEKFVSLTEVIEKHVMLTIQKEFDEYFQHWFSILMGDALSVRIDEKFTPIIEQNSYETEFTNLSGGEKTSVSLAYRLALNKVINIMIDSIRTKDLVILDEPTDGFSTEQLDKLRDVIQALGLKQIIIVSHEPKVEMFVENVIHVYKENHISRVAS